MPDSLDPEHSFRSHLIDLTSTAIAGIGDDDSAGTYAISFLIHDDEDDPRRPTLTVGHNTEQRVDFVLRPTDGFAKPDPGWTPEEPGEARWNYAFWLQDDAAIACDLERDPRGVGLRRKWIESLGLWFEWPKGPTDSPDWKRSIALGEEITRRFARMCVEVAGRLHSSGLLERTFGRSLPVIVHELEYYEEIAAQTELANPPGVAADFAAWVRSL